MNRRQWWWLIPAAAIGFSGLDDLMNSGVPYYYLGGIVPVGRVLLGA